MDSLVANYASSDEEEEEENQQQQKQQSHPCPQLSNSTDKSFNPSSSSSSSSSNVFSLPQPKSSSPFVSLPPPKSHLSNSHSQIKQEYEQDSSSGFHGVSSKPTSLFSYLPQPKSQVLNTQKAEDEDIKDVPKLSVLNPTTTAPLDPKPKRVVQFKPPMIRNDMGNGEDDDDDDDDEEERKLKARRLLESSAQTPTVKSFLSSIPAPKNSKAALGALPSSGSARRSIIEAEVPSLATDNKADIYTDNDNTTVSVNEFRGNLADGLYSEANNSDNLNYYQGGEGYVNHGSYGTHENYGNYEQYDGNWASGSISSTLPEISVMGESDMRIPGKRRKNDIPMDIVEVKQDELMKNRPREDQTKMTGIAFGPSYQPVSSAKGKPSKLHKRKHQIGTLYYDMKQKETELSERRSRGYLTKAETQAKYGW